MPEPPEAGATPCQEPEQQRIGVFLRLRPVPRPSGRVVASPEEGWVEFNVPRDASQGLINNSRESYRFPFDGLLPAEARQDEVFERVAAPVLLSALDGYNGTVFAFGQTGSGKTFTICGGTERYADRGLIPRAISALFAEAARRTDHTYVLHISYMEVYCETGFDLLEPNREVKALEDLPKLFLGDTNRVVAETPLNQASSRSHCIFTLHIEARRVGESVVRRSKLHFVDLAGSERVVKTGLSAHAQLKEAKYINLSLHFLEQVIISLQEGRAHVPYRNSMLTQVLRDSLGGNTRTVMVAAVAPEAAHIEESISTCRFAQRVAMITNRVEVNEELDLELLVRRLKQENALLRQELQLLRSGGTVVPGSDSTGGAGEASAAAGSGPEQQQALSEAEHQVLRRQVQAYVEDTAPDASLDVQASMLFIHAAFGLLKGMVRGGPAWGHQPAALSGSSSSNSGPEAAAAEVRSLRQLVQDQEQQIGVLAGVLRKQGLSPDMLQQADNHPSSSSSSPHHATTSATGHGATSALAFSEELLEDQHKAFEYFCTTSPAHDAVAEHKAVLRGKYEEARALGARVAASKQRIGELKAAVERRRLARSMAALLRQQAGGGNGGGEQVEEGELQDAEEESAKGLIEKARPLAGAAACASAEKAAHREAYGSLRGVKAEVDGVQAMLEQARVRLQRDFQAWYATMARSGGSGSSDGVPKHGMEHAAAAPAGEQQVLVAEAAPPDPFAGVEAEVLSAARPLLTGNSQADADIVKFYQARHALLRSTR
ncbi:hypothetical protein CHLNCDRAFT_135529 [Chlorella variabilis]|uniref:Kinesin-like protein n=1 Tax=Chlorella variabilis TaxID=554065 RepID=E1ZID5_CHLVA|nr:hypothetical protein CHLNCDRAFT_135529 [Chlorella variabilis]EFN54139.1 hypothetical protein CHLNCDRAFT_135529 [Chlorella variabilis]|eukprot:XP_005846241.1 hypothetical protein CHLNCDRAFT_135529 [Chlorella variabilis]